MNIEQQKKLYEEGGGVILYTPIRLGLQHKPSWRIVDNFNCKGDYRLIHKKHSHILEAFLEGCKVYNFEGFILGCPPWNLVDFINDYNGCHEYIAVPKSLENCYCLVTKTHILQKSDLHCSNEYDKHDYIIWQDDGSIMYSNSKYDYKQIEYSIQLRNWIYCPKETTCGINTDSTISSPSLCPSMETSETDVDEINTTMAPINNFKEYGFTADFHGEIFYKLTSGNLIGRAWAYGEEVGFIWSKEGIVLTGNTDFELTPIAPEITYPIFKKAKSGDIFKFTDSENMICVLSSTLKSIGASFKTNTFSHDVWEDIPYAPERGLYHGQPVYFINQGEGRTIDIWDITKQYTSNFGRDANIEPISLETLKTLPFIWEQYKAFIKEN